jgi:hypothetical protein
LVGGELLQQEETQAMATESRDSISSANFAGPDSAMSGYGCAPGRESSETRQQETRKLALQGYHGVFRTVWFGRFSDAWSMPRQIRDVRLRNEQTDFG